MARLGRCCAERLSPAKHERHTAEESRWRQEFDEEIALHIAAADPRYVRREDVPGDVLDREKDIYRGQFADSGKPGNVVEKIVEGKLGAFYSQVVLLDQPSVRDPEVTVSQMVAQASAKTGENITVSRFARFKVGELAAQ